MAIAKRIKRIRNSIVLVIGILLGIMFTYFFFMPEPTIIELEPEIMEAATCENIHVINDREYFEAVRSVLRDAKESIHVVMFNVNYYVKYPNSTTNKIIRELENAVERGVEVKIVTDEFQSEESVLKYLQDKGIDIKYDSSDKTTHSKLIIVDGEIVVVGSTNWSYYAIDENHESNVIIESEIVAKEFELYFEEIWNES